MKTTRSRLLRAARLSTLSMAELRRAPPTVSINLDELIIPPYESDPVFSELCQKVYSGKAEVAMTRVDRADILDGFLRIEGSQTGLVQEPTSQGAIDSMVRMIRAGHRPIVYLYRHGVEGFPLFSCPDDAEALRAYNALNIKAIPSAIMGDFGSLKYASLVCVHDRPGFMQANFRTARPGNSPLKKLLAIEGKLAVAMNFFSACKASIESLLRHLHAMHAPSNNALHYHEIVASNLVRAYRQVESIDLLFRSGMSENAMLVARSLYELAISFHLDWLSPEIVGPMMTIASQGSPHAINRAIKEIEQQRLREGWSQDEARAERKGKDSFYSLLGSVKERAELSWIGEKHGPIYHHLSRYTHQDVSTAVLFTGFLEKEFVAPRTVVLSSIEHDVSVIADVVNIALGLLLHCVEQDLGSGQESS